jgi:hypothetical protein
MTSRYNVTVAIFIAYYIKKFYLLYVMCGCNVMLNNNMQSYKKYNHVDSRGF